MRRSITTFAWLRDLAIVVMFIGGIDLFRSEPRIGVLMILTAGIVFIERVLWSWYLLNLRDETPKN
jgi:hypothetical protein